MNIIKRTLLFWELSRRIKYSEAEIEMRKYIAAMVLMRGAKK